MQSLQNSYKLKKLLYIVALSSLTGLGLMAHPTDDKKTKPDDGKRSMAKRDDTTTYVVNQEILSNEEIPDTTQILFPSHDLYAIWDTSVAHPYHFAEQFKQDSVTIKLVAANDGGFKMPFKGHVTSEFGWRRYRPHYGTDIDLETGDTVGTAFDGMVRLARYCNGYGNCVIIRHNNGLETVYAHLSKMEVQPGQMLKAGEMVGLGGNTGRSYGSHLHFEMRYLGQALDTEDFIDYTAGTLKCDTFILRKADVENKYDLRALRGRHKRDLGLAKRHYHKNGKYYASAGKAKKGKKKYARKKSYGKVKKKIVYTKATKRKPASKVSKSTKGKQIAKKAKSTKL
jgi:hypothetical protein